MSAFFRGDQTIKNKSDIELAARLRRCNSAIRKKTEDEKRFSKDRELNRQEALTRLAAANKEYNEKFWTPEKKTGHVTGGFP